MKHNGHILIYYNRLLDNAKSTEFFSVGEALYTARYLIVKLEYYKN